MTSLYGFASRLSGCLAGLCAVLALLATPSSARADTYSDCIACCSGHDLSGQEYSDCFGNCMSTGGQCNLSSICDNTCSGSYNQCGDGTCDKKNGCDAYTCKIIVLVKQCECNRN